jgi:hypothetical protein
LEKQIRYLSSGRDGISTAMQLTEEGQPQGSLLSFQSIEYWIYLCPLTKAHPSANLEAWQSPTLRKEK